MDITDVKSIVREEQWEWEKNHLDDKDCPGCKANCTMIRVLVMDDEGDCTNKWRCLNCLGLFTEGLKETE